jgi:hypothetical protein
MSLCWRGGDEMLPDIPHPDIDVAVPQRHWRAARDMKPNSAHAWPATVLTSAIRSQMRRDALLNI